MGSARGRSWIVTAAFATSGVVHLIRPKVFEPLIPAALGPARPWVLASGAAELVCAAGLVTRRRWAPPATVAVLAAIWVGNWHMAITWQRDPRRTRAQRLDAWGRLPLQIPLMQWAWQAPTIGRVPAPTRTLEQ